MSWTQARVAEHLNVSPEIADRVIGLVRGEIDPFTLPGVDVWRQACYNAPRAESPEVIMLALSELLDMHGTEPLWGSGDVTTPAAEYVNPGDTYAPTIVYDYRAGRYRLTSWGDFFEKFKRRYGLQ